jgi:hypothetical protein
MVAKKISKSAASRKTRTPVLRFAQPFYTSQPIQARPNTPHGRRMLDWIAQKFGPIPKPKRSAAFALAEIIGAPGVAEIESAGAIRFQADGDTGRPDVHNANQENVARQMSSDFNPAAGARNPAFLAKCLLKPTRCRSNHSSKTSAPIPPPCRRLPAKSASFVRR